jgi:hypothetical protein
VRRYRCASMASAAESFRSTCDSERSAPECSRQRFPAGTPHVGQGTEDNCVGVRSFMRIWVACYRTRGKAIQFGTLSGKTEARGAPILLSSKGLPSGRRIESRAERLGERHSSIRVRNKTERQTPALINSFHPQQSSSSQSEVQL